MSNDNRIFYLRIALIVIGLILVLAVYPLMILWPSGWAWGHGHSHYAMMIVGVYATLGIFLILAARDPLNHRSLIWFTVWSSLVHGIIMAIQSVQDPTEYGHLIGDVPALFIVAIALAALMPRSKAVIA